MVKVVVALAPAAVAVTEVTSRTLVGTATPETLSVAVATVVAADLVVTLVLASTEFLVPVRTS